MNGNLIIMHINMENPPSLIITSKSSFMNMHAYGNMRITHEYDRMNHRDIIIISRIGEKGKI